ncbi:MAG: hypothetical protein ACI841_001611 [Planctomycetota bacterium]|jgi:hypothetical protein
MNRPFLGGRLGEQIAWKAEAVSMLSESLD